MIVVVPAVNPASVAAISAVLPTLSTLAFGARVYDRKIRRRIKLEKDDYALCFSLVFLWALATVNFVGVGLGVLGLHSKDADGSDKPDDTVHRTKADLEIETIVQVFSFIEKFAFFAYKASVCFAYRRIFPYQTLRRVALGVLVFLVCQLIGFVIATALQCPVRNWGVWYESWAERKHCAQSEVVWVAYAVSEVVADLFLLLSPLPYLARMNLRLAKKVSMVLVFSLGALSVAVGIARLGYLLAFTYTGTKGYRDLMGLQSTMLVWSLTECAVAIIASNISAMRNLIFRDRWGNTKEYWQMGDGGNRRGSSFLGSDLVEENRFSERRRLRDRSRSVARGRSRSTGPPLVQGLAELDLGPTVYGRKGSWA